METKLQGQEQSKRDEKSLLSSWFHCRPLQRTVKKKAGLEGPANHNQTKILL